MDFSDLSDYKKMAITTMVKAAKKIIDEEGINNLSIRKVGEVSRFNSATLYNYFENLEHLKIFACLSSLDEYIEDLENYIDDKKNVSENYLPIWECFIKHSMENSDAFYNIFFNNLERPMADYIAEYYLVFPVKNKTYGNSVDAMLDNSSLRDRIKILLENMESEKFIKEGSADIINDFSAFTYESILHRVYRGSMDREEGRKKMEKYIKILLDLYKVD